MSDPRATDTELADEARRWDTRGATPAGWTDAPEAVPNANEAVVVSLRLPRQMVAVLEEFARRQDIGCEVLMKGWLDDRLRQEHHHLRQAVAAG